MEKNEKITTMQLFGMLFLSRIMSGLTYSPQMSQCESMWDHVISALIAFVITVIMMLPIYGAYKRCQSMTILENGVALFGRLGLLFVIIYLIYYIIAASYTLSIFNIFVTSVVTTHISYVTLSFALILLSTYAAFKGIEGIARASGVILFIISCAIIFIIAVIVPQIEQTNYIPLAYGGLKSVYNGAIYMISRSFFLPMLAMLLPFAKGNVKRGMFGLNIWVYGFFAFIITVVSGVLGDYAKTQLFPIYTAASVAEIGPFRRLDAFYIGIFTTGIFISISLFLFLIYLTVRSLTSKKTGKFSILVGACAIFILSVVVPGNKNLAGVIFDMNIMIFVTIIPAFIVPVLVWFAGKARGKEDQAYEE